jgi:hypothetical protein
VSIQLSPRLEVRIVSRATGPFEVSLKPLPMDNEPGSEMLGRMSIDKQFSGDLEATSRGQMLTGGTAIKTRRATWRSKSLRGR